MKATSQIEKVQFSVKGQVVIPLWLRRKFDIQPGTQAVIAATQEGILLKPVTQEFISSLRGSLKNRGVLQSLKEDRARERNR